MAGPAPQHIAMPSSGAIGGGNDRQPVGRIAILGVVAFLLQALLAPNIAVGGISPNFLMIALVPVAAMSSQRTSTIAGFLFGLVFDLLGAGPVGGMALVMAVMGFALPVVVGSVQLSSFTAWIIVLALGALAANFAYCIVISILGYEPAFFASLWFKVVPWTVYDIVIGAIVWPVYRRMAGGGASRQVLESRIKL